MRRGLLGALLPFQGRGLRARSTLCPERVSMGGRVTTVQTQARPLGAPSLPASRLYEL